MAEVLFSRRKVKFHYSYGGKYIRCGNGGNNLQYVGGTNKIMTVDRDISYTELIVKLWDICEPSISLRCTLPMEDLCSLVKVTSDEELAFVMEEYDWAGKNLKIRAILDSQPPPITN